MNPMSSRLTALLSIFTSPVGLDDLLSKAFAAKPTPTRKRRRGPYPEQSSRQAMRAHRRAQGGPGIELDASTFTYQPRG